MRAIKQHQRYAQQRRQKALKAAELASKQQNFLAAEYARQEAEHWYRVEHQSLPPSGLKP